MKSPADKALGKKKGKPSYDPLDDMMEWEEKGLPEHREKKLFQHLVDTGKAWYLQGTYGRAANDMLKSGYIKKPKNTGGKDAYGNDLSKYHASY